MNFAQKHCCSLLSLALLFLIVKVSTAHALTSTGPKKRVGIVSFVDKTGHPGVAEAAVDVLTTELVKSGKFIVIERAEIDQVLKEQALGQSGIVNPATAAQVGKVLGLQGIIVGSVSEFGRRKTTEVYPLVGIGKNASVVNIDVRIIDAETAQVLYADSGKGAVEVTATNVLGFGPTTHYDTTIDGRAFRSAVTQFVGNLINQLEQGEWRGRVVAVSGGKATINAGEPDGLAIGDSLVCMSLGEELIDPDTGVSLGREEGEVKGTCKIVGFFGRGNKLSKCQITGGSLEKLDAVKLAK